MYIRIDRPPRATSYRHNRYEFANSVGKSAVDFPPLVAAEAVAQTRTRRNSARFEKLMRGPTGEAPANASEPPTSGP